MVPNWAIDFFPFFNGLLSPNKLQVETFPCHSQAAMNAHATVHSQHTGYRCVGHVAVATPRRMDLDHFEQVRVYVSTRQVNWVSFDFI